METHDEKTEKEFNYLIHHGLSEKQFKEWVWNWLDMDLIRDIYSEWDLKIKEQEVKNMKNILSEGEK